uniref:Bax inhibitor 1 (inferred by orthology to a human protein) n=1 Tax=Strongyloides venezuelensis TaxID=75913 RepID=A0A0K0FUT5_STRVS
MNTSQQTPNVFETFSNAFNTLDRKLEKEVKDHLKKVYGTLSISMFTAAAGALFNIYFEMYNWQFLFALISFGTLIAISTVSNTLENESKRFGYLMAFTFSSGFSLGPVIAYYAAINTSIIVNAYLVTLAVFTSFTLAALYAENTKYLHLGGTLVSASFALLFTTLFFRYTFLNGAIIWGGLLINCGFILYDTQLICEKRRMGSDDYIWHSVELFIDFINVFRYIVRILGEKEKREDRRRRD